jgi:hypothetical protein
MWCVSLLLQRVLSTPTLGFDADVMMPLNCTSWLTRLLLSCRMLLGPNGWLLYSSTCSVVCWLGGVG